MSDLELLRRPAAFSPIAMSASALATLAVHIARCGTAPQPDEGTAAHLWQLLMVGQVPIIASFAIAWLPAFPRQAARVLAIQLVAALTAVAPIVALGF